jgi:uncharacterized protein (UPF0261 family)
MHHGQGKTVAILGTLDSKGEECLYVRDLLLSLGFGAILIDPGPLGQPITRGDICREEVAAKAGIDLATLVQTGDKGKIIQTMTQGLTAWIADLYREGRIHGVIALGGGQGTAMGTAAMQVLPLGFPKVMVSTIASGNMRPFLETHDIAVFPSVTDVFGINYVFERILANAVHALAGMVSNFHPIEKGNRLVIGATAFGVVTPGLMKMRTMFQEAGLEMILFHATGIGGLAMERMAEAGYFDGVVDWTTHEIVDQVGKGIFVPGKTRLDIVSKVKLPYVIGPGAIDYIVQGPYTGLTPMWKKRKHIIHNRNITLVRARATEMALAAKFIAGKVNKALQPVKILIPLKGFSEPNAQGKFFYEPETDTMFIQALKRHLDDPSQVMEIDAHINDDAFVKEGFDQMMNMLGKLNQRQATG